MEQIISKLSDDEKLIFYNFVAFPDFFSVDWFPTLPVSKILSVVRLLEKKQWIAHEQDRDGYYTWTSSFPRRDALENISPEKISGIYRNAINTLGKELPESDETTLLISKLCFLAGLQKEDLDVCLKAALIEEQKHRVSDAITIYDSILEFYKGSSSEESAEQFSDITDIFLKTLERRISLSIFDLSLKKIEPFVSQSLAAVKHLKNKRLQASLELTTGQHYWMSFEHEKAIQHFEDGWTIITQLDDKELYKRGLKVKALVFMTKGQYLEAIESYEKSLGEIETLETDNFSHLVALMIALCYVQVGVPQRGLGISERIQKHCEETKNEPLLAFALLAAGMIFMEIQEIEISKPYFQNALKIAERDNLPIPEVLAGIGLASIDCLEENYDLAAEHYKVLLHARKSSWFYFLNIYPYIETSYTIHLKSSIQPVELSPHLEFLNAQKEKLINPLLVGMIKRLQLRMSENTMSLDKKIREMLKIEESMKQTGAAFELAKTRVELARLCHQNHDWQKAKDYAKQAYDFYQPFAPNCYPRELKHLISENAMRDNENLFDLVIEMGNAVNEQDNLVHLLTNVIASITRLTGAERAAIIINDPESSELKLVASRNIIKEDLQKAKASHGTAFDAIYSAIRSNNSEIIQYRLNEPNSTDYRQIMITPLPSKKRIIGALYQDSRFFHFDPSSNKIKLLYALACQIGVAIDRARAYDEIAQLNQQLIREKQYYIDEKEEFRPFSEIIGQSNAVRVLHALIMKVAPTTSAVLIHGETGVGKELVARAIHRESSRKEGPFIRVNCAALADSLIDSELFGHEKGAFTGAIKTKAGRFELANQGTIFLDEISELPHSTQTRLLRVLQEKEFQRVGGTQILKSNFRLVTATNKNLHDEVIAKKFREDLFYRLNVFPIYVPPLRERKDDIPLLAVHFYNLFCTQNNKSKIGIPESEMKKLQNYSWPGNIRELSNMIERAVISGDRISFPEIEVSGVNFSKHSGDGNLKSIVTNVERESILEALKKTNGKVSGKDGAATLLGMNRSALLHRMRKLEIQIERNAK